LWRWLIRVTFLAQFESTIIQARYQSVFVWLVAILLFVPRQTASGDVAPEVVLRPKGVTAAQSRVAGTTNG